MRANKGKKEIALHMHEDVSIPLPPFYRAMRESKDLEQELAKIEEACKRSKANQKRALENTEQLNRAYVTKKSLYVKRAQTEFLRKRSYRIWPTKPIMK